MSVMEIDTAMLGDAPEIASSYKRSSDSSPGNNHEPASKIAPTAIRISPSVTNMPVSARLLNTLKSLLGLIP